MIILTSKRTIILDVYSSFGYDENCRGGVAKNIENDIVVMLLLSMMMMTNTGEDNKIEREWLWQKKKQNCKISKSSRKNSSSANKFITNEKM